MAIDQYTKQAQEFLTNHGISFSVTLIGSDCPKFCEDARVDKDMDKVSVYPRKSHIHGKHYRITISRSKGPVGSEAETAIGRWLTGTLTMDFWNSYADEEHNAYYHLKYGELSLPRENQYWDKLGKFPRPFIKAPKSPTAYDVLASITKSEPGTFEDFCGGYGYDSDSRRAYQTYEAVVDEWKKVRAFFTDEELTELQEIQ